MIPIFDSLSHPTINGDWILPKYAGVSSIDILIDQMKKANIKRSLAVGMNGIGGYDQNAFISLLSAYSEYLTPIAFFDFKETDNLAAIKDSLSKLKMQGYRGIKLHPRFSSFSLTSEVLAYIINSATELGLVSLLCTYFTHNSETSANNSIETLCKLLLRVQDSRLLLLHSGTTHVLDMIDVGRSFKNVLLDMSFTMCKYEGSSIDWDIKFAFKTFDQRVCIGADWPEFSMMKLRERFEFLTDGLSKEKKENIAYKNLESFLL